MSILTTKNIFFFVLLMNLSYILCGKDKCETIDHCLKCRKEDKCDRCEIGYRLNEDRTKCESRFKSNLKKKEGFNIKKKLHQKNQKLLPVKKKKQAQVNHLFHQKNH